MTSKTRPKKKAIVRYFVLFPIILPFDLYQRYKEHQIRPIDDDEPRPLPAKRPRRLTWLTPPAATRFGKRQKPTSIQEQSMLFTKLPIEIRQFIYTEALKQKHGRCHVFPAPTRLSFTGCQELHDNQNHGECWDVLRESREYSKMLLDTSDFRKNICINLLRTCRRVYSEAVDILYSENEFSIHDGFCFSLFGSSILPHRFDSIRNLSINWRFQLPPFSSSTLLAPYDAKTWLFACHRIADMPSLQSLKWFLSVPPSLRQPDSQNFDSDEEKQTLEPLQLITKPRSYEVILYWPARFGNSLDTSQLNFTLTRGLRWEDSVG